MPTTVANRLALAKEVWDSDTMAKQFYDACPWLDMIEKRQRQVIGKRAQVPVHLDRAGGITTFSSAGSSGTTPGVDSINNSGAEVVSQAQYNMAYNYFPVGFQVGALNEITGGAQSVGDSFEHTISQGIKNTRNHISRQFLTGHGRIAWCGTSGGSLTVELATPTETPAGEVSGYHALGMGWIVADDRIQVGTIADPDSLTTNNLVTSVIESETDPDVVTTGTSITPRSVRATQFGSRPTAPRCRRSSRAAWSTCSGPPATPSVPSTAPRCPAGTRPWSTTPRPSPTWSSCSR